MAGLVHCGTFLLFAAFVLLLLASITSPVVNRLSFMDVTGQGYRATFGTFGYCYGNGVNDYCSPRRVGYDIAAAAQILFDRQWSNNAVEALSKVLILHPIACGLTFLALLVSACSDRLGYIFASLLALLAFLVSLAAMVVDFVLFGIIKREVNRETNLDASYANATWMVLAATVVLFFSVFFVLFSCCTARRNDRRHDRGYEAGGYVGNGPQMGYAQPQKNHWWSRRRY